MNMNDGHVGIGAHAENTDGDQSDSATQEYEKAANATKSGAMKSDEAEEALLSQKLDFRARH